MRLCLALLLWTGFLHAAVWPGEQWETCPPAEAGMDPALLQRARDYALTGGGSGCITRGGKLVMRWGDAAQLYDLKSTTKSIGVTALALALQDGKMRLDDLAQKYHPDFGVPPESNPATGWLSKITLRQLADQTAGFEKPGGYQPLLFEPGTQWHYSDSGPNWLAECVTYVYGRDLNEVMFERVFGPLGIKPADLRWRRNQYRPHEINGVARREFGAGIHANVEAMARIGYLYLHGGQWQGRQIIPADFVEAVRVPGPAVRGLPVHDAKHHGQAAKHYSLLWWNNADGALAQVPRDAHWSWGLYDSLILVIPSLDLVVARAGKSWKRKDGADHYEVLKPFYEPIVASVAPAPAIRGSGRKPAQVATKENQGLLTPAPTAAEAPYPRSPVIRGIQWAPKETILRDAKGSDNWPITWADDDALYTAYGDGWGFDPRVPEKLSMGLAKVVGAPASFQGINVRSPSAESVGNDVRGRKASGMLMVEGVLYMLVRNAGNAHLGWSTDYAKTWTWADWKFTTSFGCPSFLNFGKNYAGARDEFVYVYSFDSDSAYQAADRHVLARVPKNRIREQSAYEFFVKRDGQGRPVWSRDIGERGAVFEHPGNCYRSGITYNAALKRYLWCNILPASKHPQGMRFQGGFGIYDAPEPWGPWTTVFYAEEWDVGPGETSSFPTKWMSADGKTLHLVFSGDDYFSVRQAVLEVAP